VPVGIGARWRTTRDLEENGLHTSTTNTIDLTAIDGDKLTFSLATEIHAADQKVAQQGVDIDVSHLAGTGSGQGTIDLAHFVMTGELSAAMHADMTAAGEASAMDLSMKTTITPR
jgi:hypothetical protein